MSTPAKPTLIAASLVAPNPTDGFELRSKLRFLNAEDALAFVLALVDQDALQPPGAPQLPAFTFTAGAIGSGLFTTNNAAIVGTTIVIFSKLPFLGDATDIVLPGAGTLLFLTDAAGLVTKAVVEGISGDVGGNWQTQLGVLETAGVNWSGKYTMSFAPTQQNQATVGLNNVDNTSDVNKPVSTAQGAAIAACLLAAATDASSKDTLIGAAAATDASTKADAAKAYADSLAGNYATAAQGVKADSALQDASAFATAAQGVKADSAVQPGDAGLVPVDSGWTGNADGGDKTAVVPSEGDASTALDDFINTVGVDPSSGIGLAFKLLVARMASKIKAVEAALRDQLRPNA